MNGTDDARMLRQHVADLEGRINALTDERASRAIPVSNLGNAIRRALIDANAVLAGETTPVAVADLSCEIKGIIGVNQNALTIDVTGNPPPAALSTIRLTVARVPDPPRS